jgi:hypothetical protein
MPSDYATDVAVIDFRRHSMVLEWHSASGTWSPFDVAPALVHGIAFIRVSQPNICIYAQLGRLTLQIGPSHYVLSEQSPRIRCTPASFGLRKRFIVESGSGEILYSYAYWTNQGPDFFSWLAACAEDPDWRTRSRRLWSAGVAAAELRSAGVATA